MFDLIAQTSLGFGFLVFLIISTLGIIANLGKRLIQWPQTDWLHKFITIWGQVVIVVSVLTTLAVLMIVIGRALYGAV